MISKFNFQEDSFLLTTAAPPAGKTDKLSLHAKALEIFKK
jgi:hypothetical protein